MPELPPISSFDTPSLKTMLTSSERLTPLNPAVSEDQGSEESETKCVKCGRTQTPLWRRDNSGKPLCNVSCYLNWSEFT